MRKFYHSYYSLPALEFNRWNIPEQFKMNLYLAALSVEYLHRHNREVILVTDNFSCRFMEHIPYDKIYLHFDGFKVPKYFWAAGKIAAQRIMPLGDIQVDTDVFFLTDRCLRLIEENQWDVVAQELEVTALDYNHEGNWYKRHYEFLRSQGIRIKANPHALNCGVLGFNNDKIKKIYIKKYFELARQIERKIDPNRYDGGIEFYAPDLILEQMNLCNVIDKYNANVLVIRPSNDYLADFKGDYLHLIGQSKYTEQSQMWVKEQLKEINPALLENLETILK